MNISVFITSYNQKEVLQEAIESVLAQTYRPHEIIIVDDFSSDGSQELINSYRHNYPDIIKPFFHETNLGVTQTRIDALQNVTGDYVTYLDGDDLFLPEKLEKEAKLIEKGDFHIAFSNNYYFKREKELLWIWAYNKSDIPNPGNMYFEVIARKFPRDSLFRMELVNYNLWKRAGFHDLNMKIYEDYEMRIRLSKLAKINYTLEPLSMIRTDTHSLSRSHSQLHLESFQYIYHKYKEDFEGLSKEQKVYVEERFQSFFQKWEVKKNVRNPSHFKLKFKVKEKLISLIQKI
ncbi:glycosyltransferase family 2 protein [Catalinimonas sp. 4WD22]|uniref:glycosyltransferase family 2 protein n=1 Tax=Catalinimonas locisalis TaxID=3133978 RepID=UPI0031014F69